MPVVFRYKGYRFLFFSNEGDPLEPMHIHVRKGEAIAKIWLDPEPGIANSYGLNSSELNELLMVAIRNIDKIRSCWDDHLNQ